MSIEETTFLSEANEGRASLTNDEIRSMVEQKTYRQARESIQGMTQHELQSLYYWGFQTRKYIFCSAASALLKEHYGVTPNYELCAERTSEYT
jgi:hypothetical protein